MTTRRRDAVANREALLDAAGRVLRASPQASIDAIAAEAGLTRRAVYGHFASRDELLRELLTRGAAQIAGAVGGVRDDDPSVHVALLGSAVWRAIAHVKVIAQAVVSGPFEGEVGAALAPIRRSLRDAVDRGCARGDFRQDAAPGVTARLIEDAALAVLDIAVARELPDDEAQRLVSATALGVAGLSWREAQDAIARAGAPLAGDAPATVQSADPNGGVA
ncbi:TetR/AcrR family transcriptional regulator [Microbacterium karelineae]|uniref:TetR/AcrR family transcriptional regulator n=1 Tax=Microbacterium karelineae TaxID=2654283 RepID=UPI0018D4D4CA|nr:TetR/AcrR family transcriptional regulator [Microbacterium karelineae]